MGASYPIIHSGFRCRRPDPDAHQCLLVVGWHRATARTADLRPPPSMRKFQRVFNLPASPSRWTLVQYGTGPMGRTGYAWEVSSKLFGRACAHRLTPHYLRCCCAAQPGSHSLMWRIFRCGIMRAATVGDRPRVSVGNAQAPFRVARYSATDDARSTGENKIQTGRSEKTAVQPVHR